MPTLTVRNLEGGRRPPPAHPGRGALRTLGRGRTQAKSSDRPLLGPQQAADRQRAADRLAEFRRRTAGRGSPSAADLLQQSRTERMQALTGPGKDA